MVKLPVRFRIWIQGTFFVGLRRLHNGIVLAEQHIAMATSFSETKIFVFPSHLEHLMINTLSFKTVE